MTDRVRVGIKLPNCAGVLCEPEWATPANILGLAGQARDLGYASVWLHDHVVTPRELAQIEEPNFHDPLTTMAVIAASVPDVTIGVATVILPLRDPVVLAKQASTLEAFFPGRFVLGVGAGQYKSEFEAFGSDFYHRRGKVTDEYLAIMNKLAADGPATHAGEFRSVTEAVVYPKAAPHLWVGANAAVGVKRALRQDGWIFSMGVKASDIPDLLATAELPVPAGYRIALTATAMQGQPEVAGDDEHRLHQHANVLAGTAEEVAEGLNAYVGAGVTDLLLSLRSRDLDHMREQMHWFTDEVEPLLGPVRSPAGTEGTR